MDLFCPWEPAKYLFFSSSVPSILYYALIPGMISSIFFSFSLFLKNRKDISVLNFIYLSILFFLWGIFALILFATNNPDQVMFYWSLTILVETLIYLTAVHFAYGFLYNKRFTFNKVLLLFIPMIPIIFLLGTKYNLYGVNLADCTAIEGPIALYYSYIVELFYSIIIISLILKKYLKAVKIEKNRILYFGIGLSLFLITFSSGNIVGSFTDDWVLSQLGYFGMPIFVGFLAYLVVKYKAFSIKFLATQVLVWGLVLLIGSQFLFIRVQINFILSTIAFIGIIIFGRILIRSVKKEVEQRERLENLRLRLEESNLKLGIANDKLEDLNKLKSEFVSLASHQLRSPLTAIKGYTSMLMQGDYGEINKEAKETIGKVMESSNNLSMVVEDLLNVSKIEQGGMKYEMTQFDFTELVNNTLENLSITAKQKNLELINNISKENKYIIDGDKEKLRQVLINLIDNSIKYTPKGQIEVSISLNDKKITLSIKDTGVGIDQKIIGTLFEKFSRGDGVKSNSSGSGLGLYLAKEIIEAHHGRIWVKSEGKGMGSTFFVEMEVVG